MKGFAILGEGKFQLKLENGRLTISLEGWANSNALTILTANRPPELIEFKTIKIAWQTPEAHGSGEVSIELEEKPNEITHRGRSPRNTRETEPG